MQLMTWIATTKQSSNKLVMRQLTSNESLKILTHWQSWNAVTVYLTSDQSSYGYKDSIKNNDYVTLS